MRAPGIPLLLLSLLVPLSPALAQDPASPDGHRLRVTGGVGASAQRDAGFSPLLYEGGGPWGEIGYARRSPAGHTLVRLELREAGIETGRAMSADSRGQEAWLDLEVAHLRTLAAAREGGLGVEIGGTVGVSLLYAARWLSTGDGVEKRDAASGFASLGPTVRVERAGLAGGALSLRVAAPLLGVAYHTPPSQPYRRRVVGPREWRRVEQEVLYERSVGPRLGWSASYRLRWHRYTAERELEGIAHRVGLGLSWRIGRGRGR